VNSEARTPGWLRPAGRTKLERLADADHLGRPPAGLGGTPRS
jgi:hypothetical protein